MPLASSLPKKPKSSARVYCRLNTSRVRLSPTMASMSLIFENWSGPGNSRAATSCSGDSGDSWTKKPHQSGELITVDEHPPPSLDEPSTTPASISRSTPSAYGYICASPPGHGSMSASDVAGGRGRR